MTGEILLTLAKPLYYILGKGAEWKRYCFFRFGLYYDPVKLKRVSALDGAKFVLVNEGLYEYGYFNFCFLGNMISSALIVMSEKKFPIIDLKERKEGWSNWETFFVQPFTFSGDRGKLEVCMKRTGYLQPNFLSPNIPKELAAWCKIYNDLIEFKPEIKEYIENEYKELIADKRVLRVLFKGTDYATLNPKGHPVQPTIDGLIKNTHKTQRA